MQIKTIDRAACRLLEAAAKSALEAVASKHGVAVSFIGGGSFSPTTFSVKLQFATFSIDGQVNTREAKAFTTFAAMEGVDPDALNKTFHDGRRTFTLIGYSTSKRKYPFACRRDDGEMVYFMAGAISREFPINRATKKQAPASAAYTYQVGDKVKAEWEDGKMYPAKILNVLADGMYRVRFPDGLECETFNVRG